MKRVTMDFNMTMMDARIIALLKMDGIARDLQVFVELLLYNRFLHYQNQILRFPRLLKTGIWFLS